MRQVEQGLGIGSGRPVFNRHSASATRFIALHTPHEASPLPPTVLVAHGRYAGCIGDLPSYEALTLGGPSSVSTCQCCRLNDNVWDGASSAWVSAAANGVFCLQRLDGQIALQQQQHLRSRGCCVVIAVCTGRPGPAEQGGVAGVSM